MEWCKFCFIEMLKKSKRSHFSPKQLFVSRGNEKYGTYIPLSNKPIIEIAKLVLGEIEDTAKTCPICNERYSSSDNQCYKCYRTGKHFNKNNEEKEDDANQNLKCACGNIFEDGFMLCLCDFEFNNDKEERVFQKLIKNCKETNEKINVNLANTKCDDGHFVRSRAEYIIDNWLFKNRIFHTYEKLIYIEETDSTIYPDFYLDDFDIYIEYWGMDSYDYQKSREIKEQYYNKNNINYISIEKNEVDKNIEVTLKRKINQAKQKRN